MLRLFKTNDPYLLLVVFAILLAIRAAGWIFGLPLTEIELKWILLGERLSQGFQMYSETYDYTAPLSAYTYKLLYILGERSRFLPQLVATILVMFQAAQLNLLLLRNNAFNENNYLPAFFYVVIASSLGDAYLLSPPLLSLTFVLLALNNVFRRIDNVVKDEIFLNAGLYLGIATLFYLPSFIFFLLFLVALLVFSSPAPRRLLLYFYGLLLPIIITFGYFYWFESHWYFLDSFFRGVLNLPSYTIGWDLFLQHAYLLLAVTVISMALIIRKGRFTNYQAKILRTMALLFFTSWIIFLLDVEKGQYQLIFLVPAISFLVSHYVLILRRRIWKLIMPYIIVIAFLVFPYVFFSSQTSLSLRDTNGTSLMYFGHDLLPYQSFEIASPFLDKKLSDYWLQKLDYYQSATKAYQAISQSEPDIIRDSSGVLEKIFFRYPKFESQYARRNGEWLREPIN